MSSVDVFSSSVSKHVVLTAHIIGLWDEKLPGGMPLRHMQNMLNSIQDHVAYTHIKSQGLGLDHELI